MRIHELILLTLRYSSDHMISGRTLLQKTLYFIGEKMKLGIDFIPHYYGPYSSSIADETASLCAAGIIRESVVRFGPMSVGVAFEPRQYTYQLTNEGELISEVIEKNNPEKAKKVSKTLQTMREAGLADDYRSLSVAAKMHHILKSEDKPMTPSEILEQSRELGWEIDDAAASAAVDFLTTIELAKVKPPES